MTIVRIVFLFVSSLLASAATAEPIKIGFVAPLSGPLANVGNQIYGAVHLAVEEINRAGIHNNKIELITADDECKPDGASRIAQKFTDLDRVSFVIGHPCAAPSVVAGRIYSERRVIYIPVAPAGLSAVMPNRMASEKAKGALESLRRRSVDPTIYSLNAYAITHAWASAVSESRRGADYEEVTRALVSKMHSTAAGSMRFAASGAGSTVLDYLVLNSTEKPECPACPPSGDCPASIAAYAARTKCECPPSGDCPQKN
jgi:ABC-type branched-subunit amino acid transport system substrate-binding protein